MNKIIEGIEETGFKRLIVYSESWKKLLGKGYNVIQTEILFIDGKAVGDSIVYMNENRTKGHLNLVRLLPKYQGKKYLARIHFAYQMMNIDFMQHEECVDKVMQNYLKRRGYEPIFLFDLDLPRKKQTQNIMKSFKRHNVNA